MEKQLHHSKTLIGFGILGLALLGQAFSVVPDNTLFEVVRIASGLFGIYGLRDALN